MNNNALEYYKSVASIMESFCKPLNDYFGIPLFLYFKVYKDSKFIYLSNDISLTQEYITKIQYESLYFRKYLNGNSNYKRILWPAAPMTESMELYISNKYWNGLSIVEQDNSSITLYDFISHKDNLKINCFYERYVSILEKFVGCFKSKFNDSLLPEAEKYSILYKNGHNLNLPSREEENQIHNIRSFLQSTGIYNKVLSREGNFLKITAREKQCLELLVKGLSLKGISNELLLSPKTIEVYLTNIKNKTGYYSKRELVQMYRNSFVENDS